MTDKIEVLRELDELVEAARLLGATQAKKLFGCYTDEDRRFERAMYESIDKHRAALLDWEAQQHNTPSGVSCPPWAWRSGASRRLAPLIAEIERLAEEANRQERLKEKHITHGDGWEHRCKAAEIKNEGNSGRLRWNTTMTIKANR